MVLDEWKDPFGPLVVVNHEGINVVRDDLLDGGSKMRGLDYLIGHAPEFKHINEWVFGSAPKTGYAQISLPKICAKYGKKAILFMAGKSHTDEWVMPASLHEYQRRGMDAGAVYKWVPHGMLAVTQCRAREYASERDDRMLLPIGLEHPYVHQSFVTVARSLLLRGYSIREFWTVGSSGALNRALQEAWPMADANVVSVGHKMTEEQIGRAKHYRSELKWKQKCRKEDMPPFPSAREYDAKAWKFIKENATEGAFFWNVGG